VVGTRGDGVSGTLGYGIGIAGDAIVELQRVRADANRTAGVVVTVSPLVVREPFATLEDLHVSGTLVADCATSGCPGLGGGIGIGAWRGAIEVTRFVVEDSALCGVQVRAGELDLREGEIRGNPIAASVEDATFDLARLQDRVRFVENGRNLDATALPVPEIGIVVPEALDRDD
jgi:hypothetical protein